MGKKSRERNVLGENNREGHGDKGAEKKHLNLGCIYITAAAEQRQRASTSKWRMGHGCSLSACHFTFANLVFSFILIYVFVLRPVCIMPYTCVCLHLSGC